MKPSSIQVMQQLPCPSLVYMFPCVTRQVVRGPARSNFQQSAFQESGNHAEDRYAQWGKAKEILTLQGCGFASPTDCKHRILTVPRRCALRPDCFHCCIYTTRLPRRHLQTANHSTMLSLCLLFGSISSLETLALQKPLVMRKSERAFLHLPAGAPQVKTG